MICKILENVHLSSPFMLPVFSSRILLFGGLFSNFGAIDMVNHNVAKLKLRT